MTAKASCAFSPIPICTRRKSICCPTAAIMSSSAAPAAATAAGAIWPSPAGARMPRAIAGARLSICAMWPRANSGPPPTNLAAARTKGYEAIFTQARAEFRQHHAGLEIHTEISVSPEDDVELRRITLTNHSHATRVIELTSYAEVVLAPAAADAAHPAFSNLFVQTEFLRPSPAMLCTRRPRSEGEKPPWLLHLMVGQGGQQGEVSCETDRARFVGRGRTLAEPGGDAESSRRCPTPPVPCWIPSSRCGARSPWPPHETARLDLVMGVAESREAALALVEKYHNPRMADRAFDLAWTHSQVTLRHLNATEAEAQLYARLAERVDLRQPRPPRQPRRVAQQPARPKRPLELWHLRRRAARPAAHQRPGRRSRSSGS